MKNPASLWITGADLLENSIVITSHDGQSAEYSANQLYDGLGAANLLTLRDEACDNASVSSATASNREVSQHPTITR